MEILAHRGAWNAPSEKNTMAAFMNAVRNGWGFESDIRDYRGKLVISHNIADEDSVPAEDVFRLLSEESFSACFAINIKADGLKEPLKKLLDLYGITNYFCFDMSVPQLFEYQEAGILCFTRQSEFEEKPVLLDKATGIWLDSFTDDCWLTEERVNYYIQRGKRVVLVSSELHGRNPELLWERVNNWTIDFSKISLCTDRPQKAMEFFREKAEGMNHEN